jgi:hypothetical protein
MHGDRGGWVVAQVRACTFARPMLLRRSDTNPQLHVMINMTMMMTTYITARCTCSDQRMYLQIV